MDYSATGDDADDFEAVAIGQDGGTGFGGGEGGAIALDDDAFGGEAEFGEEIRERAGGADGTGRAVGGDGNRGHVYSLEFTVYS